LIKAGQTSYAICLIVQGILQLLYGDFRPAIVPEWPSRIPGLAFCAWFVGAALVGAGIAIVIGRKGREIALIVGALFLASALLFQLPYVLLVSPRTVNPFSWGGPFNALIMAGCSFVVASSFHENAGSATHKSPLIHPLEAVMPFGRILFCITIIRFGAGHFLHTTHDAALIPAWIPWHKFWTYFTGAALVGSGAAIVAKFNLRPIATLLGTMLFLWVVMLHIPRALADPHSGQGNEIESASHALADSGTALLIACMAVPKDRRRTVATERSGN
jgi:uncharacterized membrane protein YphA (DoxX/SURF4 family)